MTSPYLSRRLRILVVDDEPAVVEVLGELLRADGHQVTTAAHGREALQRFAPAAIDLVLTDRAMPEMDGPTLADEIKTRSPATPVILVTGFAPLNLGPAITSVVRKPFTRNSIADAIDQALTPGPAAA